MVSLWCSTTPSSLLGHSVVPPSKGFRPLPALRGAPTPEQQLVEQRPPGSLIPRSGLAKPEVGWTKGQYRLGIFQEI
jgi:hypothetical protein